MSAAEKLEALEAQFRNEYMDSGVRDNNAEALGYEMRNVLPEIIALVKAAEEEVANAQLMADEEILLARALSALDEKL